MHFFYLLAAEAAIRMHQRLLFDVHLIARKHALLRHLVGFLQVATLAVAPDVKVDLADLSKKCVINPEFI